MKKEPGEPDGLEELRERIEQCRRSRPRGAWLPAELREEAGRWAEKVGVYRAARALGVSYGSLRRKAQLAGKGEMVANFVEFSGAQLLDVTAANVVEVTDETGARLTIRVEAGQPIDVAAVVAAFRGTRR